MARYEEAKSAIALISRNIELLSESCLENQGMIYENDMTQKQVNDFLSSRLAFRLDENDNHIQIYRPVSELFAHITQSSRRRISDGEIHGLFNDLRHNVTGYFTASSEGNTQDKNHYELMVQANIADLIDALRTTVTRFAGYVRNEFSIISSLAQRIRENQRAITEASRLNDLFATMTPKDLEDIAQNNYVITGYTLILNREIRNRTEELNNVLHRLRENLTKLEEDVKFQRKNELIDSMLLHYQHNPTYRPAITQHDNLPHWLDLVMPFNLKAHPPVDSEIDQHLLAEYAQTALSRIKASDKPEKQSFESIAVEVTDKSGQVHLENVNPVDAALADMFDVLPEWTKRQPVSSLECFALLALDIEPRTWNLCVIDHYSNSRFSTGEEITMTYIETQDPHYDGNYKVTDLVFRRRHA